MALGYNDEIAAHPTGARNDGKNRAIKKSVAVVGSSGPVAYCALFLLISDSMIFYRPSPSTGLGRTVENVEGLTINGFLLKGGVDDRTCNVAREESRIRSPRD